MEATVHTGGTVSVNPDAQAVAVREFHDGIAPVYDELFARGGSGDRIRRRVQSLLLQRFGPGDRVLELNCGTGTDAIALAEHGIRVTATDISPRMVEMAREKARTHGVEALVTTAVLNAADVGALEEGEFDGAFSNFNGLNYLDDIGAFADHIGGRLTPGAPLICTVLNTVCLWEVLYFAATLRPGRALKRITQRGEELMAGQNPLTLRLYTPREFAEYFTRDFVLTETKGFGFLLPPAGFASLYSMREGILRSLERLEDGISDFPPVYNFSDHYLVEFRKRDRS